MPSLTASSSSQGEKPEGPAEHELTDASLNDMEHGGTSAGATSGLPGTSAHHPGNAGPATTETSSSIPDPVPAGDVPSELEPISDGMEHFRRLRRRLLVSTLLASSAAVPVCWLLFDLPAALSLLVGAVAGLLYLVLLARSVARLGGDKRSVSKIQLLVPVVLVLASARLPNLELVPALVGFLLYKPALLVQAYLDR